MKRPTKIVTCEPAGDARAGVRLLLDDEAVLRLVGRRAVQHGDLEAGVAQSSARPPPDPGPRRSAHSRSAADSGRSRRSRARGEPRRNVVPCAGDCETTRFAGWLERT